MRGRVQFSKSKKIYHGDTETRSTTEINSKFLLRDTHQFAFVHRTYARLGSQR